MTLREMQKQAVVVKNAYHALGQKQKHKSWDVLDYCAGFMGDLGQLTKLIMEKEGLRNVNQPDLEKSIAHELDDCLWSLLIIADQLNHNFETSFPKNMQALAARMSKEESL